MSTDQPECASPEAPLLDEEAAPSDIDDPLLEKIEKAAEAAAAEVDRDSKIAEEPPQLAAEENYLDNRLKELRVQEYEDNLEARKTFARWTFKLMGIWLFAVLLTVWMSAASVTISGWPSWLPRIEGVDVSDNVLIALITTTTANILGLLVIIFNYLFPKKGSGD